MEIDGLARAQHATCWALNRNFVSEISKMSMRRKKLLQYNASHSVPSLWLEIIKKQNLN